MKITVLFFAQLREVFGVPEQIIEVSEGSTVKAVAEHVISRPAGPRNLDPEISRFARNDIDLNSTSILYAVNENFVSADEELHHGDTLALMTPVAGG